MSNRARELLLCVGVVVGLVGCAVDRETSPALTWRPGFEQRLAQLDAALEASDRELEAREPRIDDVDWVVEQLALLGARDRLVQESWTSMLGDVPPLQRSFVRQRLARRVHETQLRNAALIEPLLDRHGWFTISDFGPQADRDAWRVIQHADGRPELQERVLLVLDGLVEVGECDPAHYAYLADRVAIGRGEPQTFGTQGECVGTGVWRPFAIIEPENVDARRAQLRLAPLAEYVALAGEICP
ncbi:DUF6624 domain-containing protein [Engelhardtia mirabilis]|uniref:Lipoprotein n=1 Tax=Engelhardtia mirabilis TaxID=2528011 RepID=A0A518BIV4_9BACT|nr:hypothetical protein Pla133_19490 [Planctomycetes bacterium Pla133]QDV01199.1 hypothetical protein Pla86_19480 [Planctomycetes bacterium Pla86]